MAFTKIKIHPEDIELRKKLFKKEYPERTKDVFEFLDLLKIGEINKGKEIQTVRLIKYLHMLKPFFNYFKGKDIKQLKKKDIQNFIKDLTDNKIKKRDKSHYSDRTKLDIKITIRTFLKWKLPDKYADLTGWMDTRQIHKTPDILTEVEVEKLYKSCKTNAERFLIAVLFDSGARAEEFLNIRFEDIIEPTENFPYYKLDLKEEYSKTAGRTIGLYWKYSTEAIRNYLSECDKSDLTKPVYNKDYDAIRMFLTRLGKRILKKRVHFHLFRKSSATYYANLDLGREKLCIRYGWKFSSDMVDIYIKRAGIKEDEIKDKILNNDLGKISKENQELKTQIALVKDEAKSEMETMKEKHEKEMNAIKEDVATIRQLMQKIKKK
jgi:integrase